MEKYGLLGDRGHKREVRFYVCSTHMRVEMKDTEHNPCANKDSDTDTYSLSRFRD